MTTQNGLDTTLKGQSGTGEFAGTTSPTFTDIFFSPTTQGIHGTPTNDNASSGYVGEFVSSIILSGSAISLTSTTPANVTSISLTAGDWDVYGNVTFIPGGTQPPNSVAGWISTTSATLPDNALLFAIIFPVGSTIPSGSTFGTGCPFKRISISATTTVYLEGYSVFGGTTITACGGIFARRIR